MFINKYPIFVKKNILKIEMLENLRDFPRDLADVFYKDYSNGILSGCEIEVDESQLVIHPGIVIYDHKIYLMKRREKIPYSSRDCDVYLKIKFLDENKDIENVSCLSQIILDMEEPNQKDEMELCRFRLQQGSTLRSDYKDLEDYSTRYDTLNQIHIPYASKGESTLWPDILDCFVRETMESNALEPIDLIFCMSVLRDDRVVPRAMIVSYLENRTQRKIGQCSNYELYEELVRAQEEISQGRSRPHSTGNGQRSILLV